MNWINGLEKYDAVYKGHMHLKITNCTNAS